MFSKSLLVIAYYFPPMGLSGVQRILKFIKYLPELGWKINVLTITPRNYYAYDQTLFSEIEREEVKIYRTDSNKKQKTKKFPSYFTQKVGRAILQTIYQPDSKIRWKKAAVKLGEQIISNHNIDAILSTAPPFTDFLVARELSKKYKIPFIVDYRDIWVDNPFHFFPTPFHKSKSIKLESDILKHAKKAIVTTRHAKELLLKRYRFLSHDDIVIIPHGFDSEDFEEYENIKSDPNKFIITHSGVFQDDRTPKYFLKALANFLEGNPEAKTRIEARFVGLMRQSHLKLINKYGLERNVQITGYVPHSESIKLILESDVLWLMLNDTVRSPGKLYEYFGARKPLLVCVPDGVIRRTAIETNAAIVTEPDDIKAIEKSIKMLYKQWLFNSLPKPDENYINQFDRRKLTSELARELALASDL